MRETITNTYTVTQSAKIDNEIIGYNNNNCTSCRDLQTAIASHTRTLYAEREKGGGRGGGGSVEREGERVQTRS